MSNLALINRATKKGFIAYMTANPVYFHCQFGKPATQENIVAGYKEAMRLRKQIPAFPQNTDDNEISFEFHKPHMKGKH